MRLPLTALIALMTGLAPLPARTQPSSDDFPLGLAGLQWGMEKAQASERYLRLAPEAALPTDLPASTQAATRIAPYKRKSCTFEVLFYFYSDGGIQRLSEVNVFQVQPDSPNCANDVREDLIAHYGKTEDHGTLITPTDDELVWLTDAAKYDKEHPEETAKKYQGMDAMQRLITKANAPGPKARFINVPGSFGVRVFLYSPNGPGRIIFG